MKSEARLFSKSRKALVLGAAAGTLSLAGYASIAVSAGPKQELVNAPLTAEAKSEEPGDFPPEVIIYATDLPESALSEFDFRDDPASPGGRMVGTPNKGDELDPPPEEDPHVTFKARVQRGVPYRCWIHMKVGKPKGKSRANMIWVQFTGAVDKSNREVLRPGTGSYLTAQGPAQEGWAWVGCELAGANPPESLIHFGTSGEVTVYLQAGMEGVAFDQFLLSPARFLEKPPSEAVVKEESAN